MVRRAAAKPACGTVARAPWSPSWAGALMHVRGGRRMRRKPLGPPAGDAPRELIHRGLRQGPLGTRDGGRPAQRAKAALRGLLSSRRLPHHVFVFFPA